MCKAEINVFFSYFKFDSAAANAVGHSLKCRLSTSSNQHKNISALFFLSLLRHVHTARWKLRCDVIGRELGNLSRVCNVSIWFDLNFNALFHTQMLKMTSTALQQRFWLDMIFSSTHFESMFSACITSIFTWAWRRCCCFFTSVTSDWSWEFHSIECQKRSTIAHTTYNVSMRCASLNICPRQFHVSTVAKNLYLAMCLPPSCQLLICVRWEMRKY